MMGATAIGMTDPTLTPCVPTPGPWQPDLVWGDLRTEALEAARAEPLMAGMIQRLLLGHDRFADALATLLGVKLAGEVPVESIIGLAREAFAADPAIPDAALADLWAVRERDPAAGRLAVPFLHFKGYQGLQAHRLAHWLWAQGRTWLALHVQSLVAERFGMDIHPAAQVGRRVLVDHGTGLVVGETAVIGDDVSILQEVTLGGTGKQSGDRHPKVRDGVLIGAGAKVLGNIEVGTCAKIGAGSVVLRDVPAFSTVAGVPARVVARRCLVAPALQMDHSLPDASFPDVGAGI